MLYSKERAMDQMATSGLKSAKLPIGAKISIIEVIEGERAIGNRKVANDTALCTTDVDGRGRLRIAMNEIFKFRNKDGKEICVSESGASKLTVPDHVQIVSSKDRTDRDGNTVYPLQSYNLADDFAKSEGKMTWNQLVAGGVKDDNKLAPVQDYVVAVI